MKSLLLILGLALLSPAQDGVDDPLGTFAKQRDDASDEVLEALRLDGTEATLDGLLAIYPNLESSYMQIRLIGVIASYEEVAGQANKVAEFIATAAANNQDEDVREAAMYALAGCRTAGPRALRTLVETPLPASERELALQLFIEMAPADDFEFLHSVYLLPRLMEKPPQAERNERSKKKPKKRGKKGEEEEDEEATPDPKYLRKTGTMRKMAMEAIWSRLDAKDLLRYHEREPNLEVQPVLLRALHNKRAEGIDERLESYFKGSQYREMIRVVAAELLAERQGEKVIPLFMDVAKSKGTTTKTLYDTMAALMQKMPAEVVTEELKGRVSRAKGAELTFLMDAMPLPCDPKIFKKLAKGLKSKEPHERVAAVRFLARAGSEDSIKTLDKAFRTEKEMHVKGALLAGLTKLHKTSDEWMAELFELCQDKDEELAHVARIEVLRIARPADFERFVQWLSDPNWTIRQGALQALESIGEPRVVGPIVARIGEESGRLRHEFGEALFRLTGQDFGTRAPAWRGWFEKEGADVKILSKSELKEARKQRALKAQKERSRIARFFDIEIKSNHVIFVVDVSGSMEDRLQGLYSNIPGDTRMEKAKKELAKAIKALPDGTHFNIISFSGGIGSWWDEPLAEMGEPDRKDALEWVDRLGAGGGTNLYEGLLEAMDDPSVDTIVVLSDGVPSVGALIDPGAIREDIDARNRERNIRIHTIALGGNLQILEWLAEDSGGNFVQYE